MRARTLGKFWGIQIAWLTWLSRIAAASGTANLFTTYLGQVAPGATQPVPRALILSALIGVLAAVNYVGVKSGARFSDFLTATKVLLLAAFVISGLVWMKMHGAVQPVPLTHAIDGRDWLEAILVLVYAYGGFEAVLLATGEMRDPRRDAPFALLGGLAVVAVIYSLIQVSGQRDAGRSGGDDETNRGIGGTHLRHGRRGPDRCRRADFDLRVLERKHAAYAAINVCDGGARGVSGDLRANS